MSYSESYPHENFKYSGFISRLNLSFCSKRSSAIFKKVAETLRLLKCDINLKEIGEHIGGNAV